MRCIVLILLFLPLALAHTEIFPDPPNTDNNKEYIELLSNQSIEHVTNSTFIFSDNTSSDTAQHLFTFSLNTTKKLLLFVEEGFNYTILEPNMTCIIYSLGTTIGNNLGNDKDYLLIKQTIHNSNQTSLNNTQTLLNTTYETRDCARGGNCSLTLTETVWDITTPTPCQYVALESIQEIPLTNLTNTTLTEINTTNTSTNVNTSFNSTNTSTNNTSPVVFNETNMPINFSTNTTIENSTFSLNVTNSNNHTNTTNLTNTTFSNESVNLSTVLNNTNLNCTYNFSIQSQNIISEGETVLYESIIQPEPFEFVILYWWEDLYGEIIKSKRETTNTNTKKYTPKLDNIREKGFLIKMQLITCNQTYIATKHVLVIDGDIEEQTISRVSKSAGSSTSSGQSLIYSQTEQEDTQKIPTLQLDAPKRVYLNTSFKATVNVYNEGVYSTLYLVWVYVYIGSKNVTPREDVYEVLIPPLQSESVIIELNPILEIGNFSIKAKVLKPGRKTPYELKKTLEVLLEPKKQEILHNATRVVITTKDTFVPSSNSSIELPLENQDVSLITGAVISDSLTDKLFFNGAWLAVLFALILFGVTKLLSRHQNDASSKKNL